MLNQLICLNPVQISQCILDIDAVHFVNFIKNTYYPRADKPNACLSLLLRCDEFIGALNAAKNDRDLSAVQIINELKQLFPEDNKYEFKQQFQAIVSYYDYLKQLQWTSANGSAKELHYKFKRKLIKYVVVPILRARLKIIADVDGLDIKPWYDKVCEFSQRYFDGEPLAKAKKGILNDRDKGITAGGPGDNNNNNQNNTYNNNDNKAESISFTSHYKEASQDRTERLRERKRK